MSRPQRRWTPKEDELLREGVKLQSITREGMTIDWNRIAYGISGRSNKDCRKRFYNGVTGGLKKGPWTEEEDSNLKRYASRSDMSWAAVAQRIGNRSADQCSKRWQHCLDPGLDRRPWTDEEDRRLLIAVVTHGTSWKDIQNFHFPARSANNIKNQYMTVTRKSVEIPADSPPCCPSLSQSNTSEPTDGLSSPDSGLTDQEGAGPSCNNSYVDDLGHYKDTELGPFGNDFSSLADFSLIQLDHVGTSFPGGGTQMPSEMVSPSEFDLFSAGGVDATQDAFSSSAMDIEPLGDISSTMQGPFASLNPSYLPLPDNMITELCSTEGKNKVAGGECSEPGLDPTASNLRVTIFLDNADRWTVMDVMKVLIQSKTKVRLETT